MSFTPKELTWLGIAKETTWGTAVNPAYFVPFKDAKPEDVIEYIKDQGIRGAMAETYNILAGPTKGTFDVSGETFPDSIGLFLLATLGTDTVTGTGPYVHTFKLARTGQSPSLTLSYYDGTSERQWAGHIIEELSFKWAAKAALEYTVKTQGKPSATTSTGTPTVTTTTPFLSWAFTATLGGTTKVNVVGFDVSFKSKLYLQYAANNSQAPSAVIEGATGITGKITFDKMDDSELTNFLSNTQSSLVLTGVQGANQIVIQISKCAFTKAIVSGKEVVQVDVDFEGLDNTTDNGPALIKLTNSVATY